MAQVMKRDTRKVGSRCDSVESLPDRVGMKRPTGLVREHVVVSWIVGTEETALGVLNLAPAPERSDSRAVDRDRLVRVASLAAGLVQRPTTDDDAVVVHGDLAGVEVHRRPLH